MAELVAFGSSGYILLLAFLILARGMDFLSTWIATPNLVLEGNPISRRLGWKIGIIINVCLCGLIATWPLPAIIIITSSFLLAARNFQSAWMMRAMGEYRYRSWVIELIQSRGSRIYVFCLLAQSFLIASIGAALIYFSKWDLVPFAIGTGIITYAIAVLMFSLFSLWRIDPPSS